MSNLYNLLKQGIISFNQIIIDKYYEIDLDEKDVILLIKLKKMTDSGNVDINSLNNEMNLDIKEIRKRISFLIKFKYIDLKSENGNEIFDFDLLYKRLANIINEDGFQIKETEFGNEIKKTVTLLENEFSRVISSQELEMVSYWIKEAKFTYDQIKEATIQAVKKNRMNAKTINLILSSKNKKKSNKIDPNLKSMLDDVYDSIKNG